MLQDHAMTASSDDAPQSSRSPAPLMLSAGSFAPGRLHVRAGMMLLLCGLAACNARGSMQSSSGSAAASATVVLPAALVAELGELARRLDDLERSGADGRALEAAVPHWLFHEAGVERKPIGIERRAQLAAVIAATSVEPRVRALAVLQLAGASELDDIPVIAPFVDASDDTGKFPHEVYGQSFRAPVAWRPSTLGRTALDALQIITGARLASPADLLTWREHNVDPKTSFAYWEGTLVSDDRNTRYLRLWALLDANPELFLRVLLAQSGGNTHPYWWGETDLVRIVGEHVGSARVLRLLGREDVWPEFTDPERFNRFSEWILDHAQDLFGPADAAGLLSLWEKHGSTYRSGDAASKLAIAAMGLNPTERVRIAEVTLGYGNQYHGPVLEELARHDLHAQFPLIQRWFRRRDLRREIDDIQTRILRGVALVGKEALPELKQLADDPSLTTDSPEVVGALVDAALAADAPWSFPERSHIKARSFKGHPATSEEVESAARSRRACVTLVQRWLRSAR